MKNQRKKLLFVVESFSSGVFTFLEELSKEIIDKYDIYIAYGVRDITPKDFEKKFDDRVHFIEVKNFTRSINPTKDLKALRELKKIYKDVKPDLIHLHSSKAGALGRFAFNGRKTPMFYTPHGYSFLMEDQSALKRFIYKFIEKICGLRRCTTVSCSEGEHKESLKVAKSATYVNNGINTEELEHLLSNVEPKKNGRFTVFTLGRTSFQKNPALFNKIAEALPEVHFLWIGDGDLRDELKADNIEITGWVFRDDALRYSLGADAFILTSLWEGLPISLLEAMYIKKPCAVTNVVGNRDVIENGRNGYVCETVQDFVNAINDIRENKAEEYVLTAYNDIFTKYNTKTMSQGYLKIYGDALQ